MIVGLGSQLYIYVRGSQLKSSCSVMKCSVTNREINVMFYFLFSLLLLLLLLLIYLSQSIESSEYSCDFCEHNPELEQSMLM